MDLDWDDITARFNAKFGKPHRTKKQILCVIKRSDDFWDPYWEAYDTAEEEARRRVAQGSQWFKPLV